MANADTQAEQLIQSMKAVLTRMTETERAAIFDASTGGSPGVRVLTLNPTDLGTAKLVTQPYRIGFPFKSFIVIDATDNNVAVSCKVGPIDSFNDAFTLKKSTSLNLPFAVNEGYLYWSAQTGKTMTILFFMRGELATNALNLTNSGGVSVVTGSAMAPVACVSVGITSGPATTILAADSTRLKTTLTNLDPANTIWISGTNTVVSGTGAAAGALVGIPIPPGGSYEWTNTGACYGIADTAVSLIGINTES